MSAAASAADPRADGLDEQDELALQDHARALQLGYGFVSRGLPRFVHQALDAGDDPAGEALLLRVGAILLRDAHVMGHELAADTAVEQARGLIDREQRRSARRQQAEAERVEDEERAGMREDRAGHTDDGRRHFTFIDADALEQQPPITWLIDGLLPVGALGCLVGTYDSFKSFVAADAVVSVAAGVPFLGRFTTRKGPALYILGEGGRQFGRRIRACKTHRGITGTLGLRFLLHPVQFMRPTDTSLLLRALEALPDQPALIVIDTMARCLVGGEENSARDVGLFVDGVERIRHATGAAVLIVHHSGKDGKTRGSTALPGAVEVHMSTLADGDFVTLTCERMKDADRFSPVMLRRRVVELEDGATSLVLVPVEDTDRPPRAVGDVPASVRIVLRALAAGPARPTELAKVTSLPDRTLFNALSQVKKWRLATQQPGGSYRLTPEGAQLHA